MPRVLRRIIVVLVGLVLVFGLGLLVAPRFGWATPFGLPSTIHVGGRDYRGGRCARTLTANATPLHRIGSVFGYFTGSKPILEPHYEWHPPNGLIPAVLYVRDSCLRGYDLSGGP